jgi:hypothetical protein
MLTLVIKILLAMAIPLKGIIFVLYLEKIKITIFSI